MSSQATSISHQGIEKGELLAGRYRIVRKIDEGGFAWVYEGTHATLHYPVAIKLLKPRQTPEGESSARARFLREAQLLASLRHPDLVHLYDHGVSAKGAPFIVMEYLTGHTLARQIWKQGAMAPNRALNLMIRCLHALEQAHDHGIVHRDLKPSNIFLKHPQEEIEALSILDFGIAYFEAHAKGRLTRTGDFIGTPEYASPEYVRYRRVSPAIDVYQMGMILIEMLTGTPLVDFEEPLQSLFAHCNGYVRPPDYLKGSPLYDVLEQALATKAKDRYPNARELRLALSTIDPASVLSPPQADVSLAYSELDMEHFETWKKIQDFSGEAPLFAEQEDEDSWSSGGLLDASDLGPSEFSALSTWPRDLPREREERVVHSGLPPRHVSLLVGACVCALVIGFALHRAYTTWGGPQEVIAIEPASVSASPPEKLERAPTPEPLVITSEPVGAYVFDEDILLGRTPLRFPHSRSAPITLTLKAPRHQDTSVSIVPEATHLSLVTLAVDESEEPEREEEEERGERRASSSKRKPRRGRLLPAPSPRPKSSSPPAEESGENASPPVISPEPFD